MHLSKNFSKILVLSFLAIFLTSSLFGQRNIFEKKYFHKSQFKEKVENLRKRFSKNKTIPKKVELAALVALSHYPELATERIIFKFEKISTTMKAQPKWSFLFKKKENRQYIVYLNSKADKSTGLALEDLSFNALVGWIGHELGHLVDFTAKSNWKIIKTGTFYFSKKKKAEYERSIDLITINHGLGHALYEGMEYVYENENLSDEYRKNLIDNYLSLQEIISQIEKYESTQGVL
jgi:hypothetical protein